MYIDQCFTFLSEPHGTGKLTKGYHGNGSRRFFQYQPTVTIGHHWDTHDANSFCNNKKLIRGPFNWEWGQGVYEYECLGHGDEVAITIIYLLTHFSLSINVVH